MSLIQLEPKPWIVNRYHPNQPLGAVIPGTCIAGQNAIFEADGYSRAFGGAYDLAETHAAQTLAYTATTSNTSPIVNFPGGALLTDFVPYQHVSIGGLLFVIQKIIDNENAVVSPDPTASASGLAVVRVPNLHTITRQRSERLSLYAGSAIRYREEAIFAVGRGPLKINGAAISSPLTATSTPQVAYPIPGGTYDVRPVGFTRPAAPTVAAVAGGTKAMTAQRFTVRVSKKRKGFPGHGLASDPADVTIVAGQRIQVTIPAFDASEGQTAAYVWVSRNDDALSGAWYLLNEFDTVGPHTVEWYDGELGEQYFDDNDPPPPSLFVTSANDHLIFASWGDAPDGSGNPTAPGPGIAVSKSNNPEAFPPTFYAFISPAEDIVGVKVSKVGSQQQDAMLYFMSANALNIGRFIDSTVSPLVVAPYAIAGFAHQYSGAIAYDYFYGFAGGVLFRTIDGRNIETEFAAPVHSDLATIPSARAFVEFDPKSGWLVIFQSNAVLGPGGKWQTKAWSYNVKTGAWNTPCLMGEGSISDFTVCGVTTIDQRLHFVTTDGKIYEWDRSSGAVISGYIATGFDPFGGSQYSHWVRHVKVNGWNAGTIKLHFDYDVYNLTGQTPPFGETWPASASRTLTNTNYIAKHFPVWRLNRHFKSLAWRVDFSIPGGFRVLESVDLGIVARDGFVN